jgi:glycerate 2-kinase
VFVAGGETTVRLSATERSGRGGRNQELALEVARLLAGEPGWLLLCGGTDGIDGPTDATGAIVDGQTAARAARARWSVEEALARHDVYPLLAAIGALYRPGPTGTNVADLVLGFVWRDRGWRVPAAV